MCEWVSEWDKKRHFLIRKLNFFLSFHYVLIFLSPFNAISFSIHFLILLISFISLQRQMKIIWAERSFCASSFFGNNRRSFSFSTCLNINLIFHYLNWFHLNEILPSPPASPLRGFCVCDFFCSQSIAKEFFCWAWIYLFELKFYVSYLTHPTPTSLSLAIL